MNLAQFTHSMQAEKHAPPSAVLAPQGAWFLACQGRHQPLAGFSPGPPLPIRSNLPFNRRKNTLPADG